MRAAEWVTPEWRAAAQEWLERRVRDLGMLPCGPLELVSLEPWSTVLRASTAGGDVYLKANIPLLAHEPALVRLLGEIDGRRVLPVLAEEAERGWMLTADGGPTLRSRIGTAADLRLWERVLPIYAELQMAAAPRARDLLAAGAFDYRLSSLLELYPQMAVQLPELRPLFPRYRELCARLRALGLPDTIHHDDFHDANVLVGAGVRFFDWHEGCLAPPFFSMLIVLRVAMWRLELDPAAPELERMRRAYLEPWSRFGSTRALREGLDVALRVGVLARAVSWRRILDGAGPVACRAYADAVPEWLGELRDALQDGG